MARYFTNEVFVFLRELEQNNEKAWWEANKERYIDTIREPALEFINDFGSRVKKISPHFTADSRTTGGSLMRPYRDIRFSSDKTPYKTNVGIQFRHESGRDMHAPGFYLHIANEGSFAGVGLWNPETATARKIREAIFADPTGWKKAAKGRAFLDAWTFDGHPDEMLKRVPREFDSGFRFADDLRRKSFTAGARLTKREITSTDFAASLEKRFATAKGLVGFLCDAVGLPF